jgi:hypothetical protein
LREGHKLHTLGGGQGGYVAGAAHVDHAKACRDDNFDGIKPHHGADNPGSQHRADNGDKHKEQVNGAEGGYYVAKVGKADADTDK